MFPIAIGASLNKWFIIPVAASVADFIVINTGLSTKEELKATHKAYKEYVVQPVENIASPLESKAIDAIGGTILESISNVALGSVIPVESEQLKNSKKDEFEITSSNPTSSEPTAGGTYYSTSGPSKK